MLTRCRTANARLSRLIEERITLARLETGVIQSQPAPTKMKKLLADVALAATDHDVKESLFELFTRGRATTDIPGLGLGLPVARTLVAAMGGEMTITDRPGGGTVVRIVLR